MKYRKKPVAIEAVQHFGDMGQRTAVIPVWLIEACANGTVFCRGSETFIKTLEGELKVTDGDWIIRGVKNELYPCKPDIFEATYEAVREQEHTRQAVAGVTNAAEHMHLP